MKKMEKRKKEIKKDKPRNEKKQGPIQSIYQLDLIPQRENEKAES